MSSADRGPQSARVIANMVISPNGATILGEGSMPLSSPADRRRFHEIRSLARAIAIGGSTFRSEPYTDLPVPVYVASRKLPQQPGVNVYDESPTTLVERALREVGSPVLVEGGVEFVKPLLEKEIINRFFLTRSAIQGDAGFVEIDRCLTNYICVTSEKVDDDRFEIWEPREQI
ncbi:MAG: hypothetical protein RLZZ317_48 [Actinomycetota bacterium]